MSAEDRVEDRAGARRLRLPAWLHRRALLLFVAALVVLYVGPLLRPLGDYTHNVVGLTFMFMPAALAWNWLGGYVGQISFGHAAMFGVGGFVAARLALAFGLPFWVTWLVGGLVAGAYGLLWGHPTLRLRGPYFSIATIGVGEATRLVATYWDKFTGGSSGLSLPISQGPTKYALYWYGLYLLAVVVALSYWLRRSRVGLGLLAIKEDVEAAAGVGVNGQPPHAFVHLGIARTHQIVRPFARLTVLENVLVGHYYGRPRGVTAPARERAMEILGFIGLADRAHRLPGELTLADRKRLEVARALATGPRVLLLDEVVAGLNPVEARRLVQLIRALFPRFGERSGQLAGSMSGGEQQMVAIARALMSRPRLLMLDEPSLGLAPVVVSQVFDTVRRLHQEGLTILLVEQNLKKALEVADRGYVVETGRIAMEGAAGQLLDNPDIRSAYLGV